MNYKVNKVVGFLCLISMFFPWVSFRLLNLDIQPWFIILGAIFVLLNLKRKYPIEVWYALLMFISCVLIGMAYRTFDFLFARAFMSYLAFFTCMASYYIYKKYVGETLKLLIYANIIWLSSGFLQFIFGSKILSFLVVARTTLDRGVTGLAPEPTFFAMFLFFLNWLLILESNYLQVKTKVVRWLLFLNVFTIIFIAKSSMIIVFLLISLFLYAFYKASARFLLKIASASVSVGLLVFILFNSYGHLYSDIRVIKLATIAFETPSILVEKDASLNDRVSHIYFSFKGSVSDYGVPHGFHNFGEYIRIERSLSSGFFWWGGDGNKIMSWSGSLVYELGILSIFMILILFGSIWDKSRVRYSIFILALLFILTLSAIPVSFPLIPMILISFHLRKKDNMSIGFYAKNI